ncbi:hypothetical protein V8J38_11420 [Brevundimonas olei]|uniref:Uncharacterized protein n=1 Tax=Brevundimonas olei TaxID=657642 RepID=A0ABZ2I8A1_9CAUL
MTHPLTPREKVAATLDPEVWADDMPVPTRAAVTDFHARRQASIAKADAVLTALASGSGDHAELARLAEAAKRVRRDAVGRLDGDDAHRIWFAFLDSAGPATVLALLAENAAQKYAVQNGNEHLEFWEARATEAERKLAEADEENTRWLFRMADIREASGIGVKPMLGEVPGALRAMRERLAEAVLVLTGIAKGEVPPEQHGHYLAHRQAVRAARTFLSKEPPDA